MKKQSLKQHSNDYYQSQQLNQKKLDRLIELSDSIVSEKSNKVNWHTIAAALIVTVAIIFTAQQFKTSNNVSQLVPQEIALNHSKQLALEFKANSYQSLNSMMHKLDFKLLPSTNTHLKGLNIVGGRYCSIQGNLAAQIRLTDQNGKLYTLYQTPLTSALTAALNTEKTDTYLADSIEISQWQENTLFFGLAR